MPKRLMTRLIPIVVVVCGTLMGIAGRSQAQLALYDRFATPLLDPARWRGVESFSTGLNPNTDAVRQIQNGKLTLLLSTYGDTLTNRDGRVGRFGVRFTDSAPITTLQAQVIVNDALVEDCRRNPDRSLARAQLLGFFFNDGSSPGPGEGRGDIVASIQKDLSNTRGGHIVASLIRCLDTTCSGTNSTILQSHIFPTSWHVGETHTLRLTWRPGRRDFLFTVNPGPAQAVKALSYAGLHAPSSPPPPVTQFKTVRLLNHVANCTTGPKRALMDASFDQILVNADAVP